MLICGVSGTYYESHWRQGSLGYNLPVPLCPYGKSSDGLSGGSLAGRLIKRCSLYGCGLAILA